MKQYEKLLYPTIVILFGFFLKDRCRVNGPLRLCRELAKESDFIETAYKLKVVSKKKMK